jgi:glycosyltransferase involved in cell wall biosynthesis
MRPIYARAKVLLALSLWWESFGRVATEAEMNAIPVGITNRGGLPEAATVPFYRLQLKDQYHKQPFRKIPPDSELAPLKKEMLSLFDSESTYENIQERIRIASRKNNVQNSAQRLRRCLSEI